ncbi:MAG: glycosyltransferase family 4 protein [Ilumatobacter sp.]|uniref:glycosyltransferase family 4 protein n=1 Tax=Ilumatobacter sp. TaxID=1967498 RepID=UPI002635966F|nr:glycosyltransferase family 4 protein [Ilumatobacter sp.]MDJ0768696.1 glycosyltransferase family 4 protein [Ilumatobacter sp.]
MAGNDGRGVDVSRPAVPVTIVHEEHLGHRTYAANLRTASLERPDIDAEWVPVRYGSIPSPVDRLPLPASVRAALAGRREVRRGLRDRPADVHMFNTQVPAALGGGLARSKPYVVITDVTPLQYDRMADGYGHRPDRPGPVRWWKHRVNRRVFTEATWCVGWSSWAAGSFVDDYGVDPARVAVIPPGVDTDAWRPPAQRRHTGVRILFVGGEFPRKGGDLLVESLASLPDDVELHLVTKTPVAANDRVRVYDDLGPNDPRLIELFRTSDVFAIPSRAETFGIAAAEASAMALPVVASDVGGFADIVADGETGFIVPHGDGAALTTALRRLVDDPALRRSMGEAARRRAVERFDSRTNAARLFDLAHSCAPA